MCKLLVVVFVLFVMASCASEPPVERGEIAQGQMPDDFSLVISVLTDSSDHARAFSATRRPSRYVVLPDGTLHYGIDSIGVPGRVWPPPIVRTLSRAQMEEIWSIVRQVGLAETGGERFQASNLELIAPPSGELVYTVSVTARQQRCDVVRRAANDAEPDAAISRLIEHLAGLAWVNEQLPLEGREMPKRYDFGPDPYERYRKPEAEK